MSLKLLICTNVLAASCEERQRERIKEEKCRVAIKGGKLGEKVFSIRG